MAVEDTTGGDSGLWGEVVVSGVAMPAGTHNLKLCVGGGVGIGVDSITFDSVSCPGRVGGLFCADRVGVGVGVGVGLDFADSDSQGCFSAHRPWVFLRPQVLGCTCRVACANHGGGLADR